MFAIISAIVFAVALLLELLGRGGLGVSTSALMALGLMLLALHMAGYGRNWSWRGWRRGVGSRRI